MSVPPLVLPDAAGAASPGAFATGLLAGVLAGAGGSGGGAFEVGPPCAFDRPSPLPLRALPHCCLAGLLHYSPWAVFVSVFTPDTAAVKAALESTYACLGITCAHVGGLLSSDGVTPEAGMEGCDLIAGYKPMGGSVKEHSEIDLDQKEMETALGAASAQSSAYVKLP